MYLQERMKVQDEQVAPVSYAIFKLINGNYKISNLIDLAIQKNQITIRPSGLVHALSNVKGNRHLLGYQQQDAQEFFQHISTLTSNEDQNTNQALSLFDMSILEKSGEPYGIFGKEKIYWRPKMQKPSPFTGLLASNLTCERCGFKVRSDNLTIKSLNYDMIPLITCL